MKTKKVFMSTLIWLLILLTVSLPWGFAQDQPAPKAFSQEELDQMLAPIALYPDSLLAQILMAATYPLEVVQAERWAKADKNLIGDQLNDALDKKDWDPSVKALVVFPQVLSMMGEKLEWTEKLGDAFLAQQDEVMDTVQKLRAKAKAAGNLRDTEEQKVIEEENVIEIDPAQPEVVYVPVYDPTEIYGPWWYPAFPPFFFLPPPSVVIGFHGRMGFGVGIAVSRAWGHAWGQWDWGHHYVNVNTNRHININRNISIGRTNIETTRWQHDVSHRKGVAYRDQATAQKFYRGTSAEAVGFRRAYRGHLEQGQQPLPQRTGGAGGQATFQQRRDTGGAWRQAVPQRKDNTFLGIGNGRQTQNYSNRGSTSRESMSSGGAGGGKSPGGAGKGSTGGRRGK